MSFRTSPLSWCGNLRRILGYLSSSIRRGRVSRPPEFGNLYGAGRETRPLRSHYGQPAKLQFVHEKNDTERVRAETTTQILRTTWPPALRANSNLSVCLRKTITGMIHPPAAEASRFAAVFFFFLLTVFLPSRIISMCLDSKEMLRRSGNDTAGTAGIAAH